MPTFLTLRPLTDDETRAIDRLAHSRTEPARAVERARIVRLAHEGARVPAIARALGLTEWRRCGPGSSASMRPGWRG